MKRTNEPTKTPAPTSASDDDDDVGATFDVKIVPFDYSHKYIHLSYHWIMGTGEDELNVLSALLDVTGLDPRSRRVLRFLLDDDAIAKSIVCVINEGGDTMEMALTKKHRAILEAARWCAVPDENEDDSKIAQIVSFVYLNGAY